MKKLMTLLLAGMLAVTVLASCGGRSSSEEAAETAAEPAVETEAPSETPEPTEAAEETEEPSETPDATPQLQTAEEAANDRVTIQNELDSIEALIQEGSYEDAVMQARALMTKNLTDADKELINQYYERLREYLPEGYLD
ncbi:MAG TPA: hypothetical protein H9900_01900 [Candidatus Monoglobus merdigallinarum]|uniref:Uncharacterized protein n=1 Tax=Candidatus Monoglobus merdigallinarum TaxID=2838698 RepID=A0A9D1PRI8_9FIRM|nr:hypothetical protein [Candidatus Monoglobus merdigallinarum]